jgi:hypothetical protein
MSKLVIYSTILSLKLTLAIFAFPEGCINHCAPKAKKLQEKLYFEVPLRCFYTPKKFIEKGTNGLKIKVANSLKLRF